jgi:ABC-type antimicrobial peptide transport system permease subunit/AraC-like DNA-binding protein
LKLYFFHVSTYDLVSLGILFSGLMLALLLGLSRRLDKTANLFLSAALAIVVLKTSGLMPVLLPALGPLLYFYIRQRTSPERRFGWKDMLPFCPLLVGYWAPVWPVVIWTIVYLYLSHRLIHNFYDKLRPVLMDRPRYAFRRLERSLLLLALLCLLWLFNDIFSFAIAVVLIGMAMEVILKQDDSAEVQMPISDRSDAREKGRRLKEAVLANRLYEDAELTLATLAAKLNIHPHDLSRIINVGLEKNFSDFINEFRVREVVRKMQDLAYDQLTLIGIAYESGFNSQRTFNRVFKEMTGKTPVEYKCRLKKESPIDKLAGQTQIQPVILRPGSLPNWAPEKSKRNNMVPNFFKVAFRTLWRSKSFSAINIAGLAIGMGSAMLILLWVQNELSHDRFYAHIDRIALMYSRDMNNGRVDVWNNTPAQMAPIIKKDYPEIEDAARFRTVYFLVTVGEKHMNTEGGFADSTFLSVLDFPLLEGSAKTALNDDRNIVITKSLASRLFGNEDAMGKVVRIDSNQNFKVTGVLKDLPPNTQFTYQYLLPWSFISKLGWDSNQTWTTSNAQTYVLLKQGASFAAFDKKVQNIVKGHANHGDGATREVFSQPLSREYLYSRPDNGHLVGGRIETVRMFIIIAVFILLIACINFMNLSTAKSEKRAKEAGIRKVVGARRHWLILQFIGESTMIALVAFALALLIVQIVLPYFDTLVGVQLTINFANPYLWAFAFAFILLTGLLAGSYPAFYLSSFRPAQVLKGTFKKMNTLVTPRKALVVLQFTFAIALIICTIIVKSQLQFAQDRDAGYNKGGLVYIFSEGDVQKNYSVIKHDLLSTGAAISVTKTFSPITRVWGTTTGLSWPGSTESDKKINFLLYQADAGFAKTTGARILQGRDIDMDTYVTDSTAVLLNEAAVKAMRLKDPIGGTIRGQFGSNLHVVGVIKDFIIQSPYDPVQPMVVYGLTTGYPVVHFRLNPANSTAVNLAKAEKIFKQYNPQYPFEYYFADEQYAQKFRTEQRDGSLSTLFAGLTIFISCLGLFGLAAYMAENRVKEIGIRKVLGASVGSIAALLSADFIKLVAISILVASPVAWWAMNKWLQNFNYRIGVEWWVFVVAGGGAIIIALITISSQAIKAALTNPVKSLRSE